jgi:hypothetical protein
VEHIDVVAFEKQHVGFRKMAAGAAAIDITADGGKRRDLLKRLQNGRIADIT